MPGSVVRVALFLIVFKRARVSVGMRMQKSPNKYSRSNILCHGKKIIVQFFF